MKAFSLKDLSQPNLGKFLAFAALDWLVIAVASAAFLRWPGVGTFLLASVIIGLAQHGLAVLGHEATHFCAARNRAVNDWVGRMLCFFPLGMSLDAYRRFHFDHHRHLGDERDPERALLRKFGGAWVAPFTLKRATRLWGANFLGLAVREILAFQRDCPPRKLGELAQLTAFWAGAGILAHHFGALPLLGLWYFSLVTTYWGVFRLRGWIEHNGDRTRSSRFALPTSLMRIIFPHDIWMHYEHHKYPTVPFFNLRKVRVAETAEPVLSFAELMASFRGAGDSLEVKAPVAIELVNGDAGEAGARPEGSEPSCEAA